MPSLKFSSIGYRIALFLGHTFVLLACILYLKFAYCTQILPDKTANRFYQPTSCFVIGKRLNTEGSMLHRYRADFLVSYNVKGISYSHWVAGNGLDTTFSDNASEEEDILSQFDVGGTYICHYLPKNPIQLIFVYRSNWRATYVLMIPALISLLAIYYLIKNFIILLKFAVMRKQPQIIKPKTVKHKRKNRSESVDEANRSD